MNMYENYPILKYLQRVTVSVVKSATIRTRQAIEHKTSNIQHTTYTVNSVNMTYSCKAELKPRKCIANTGVLSRVCMHSST